MTQTVHNNSSNQNLLSTAGFGNNLTRKFFFTVVCAVASFMAMAQTYTTKADGAWNSAATWEGGVIPGTTVGIGKIVNIKHDVTFPNSVDFCINGTVNIENDTLRFSSSYDKKILVALTGTLKIKNGGLLQTVSSNKSDMEIYGGRVSLESSCMLISKGVKATAGTKRTYKNSTVIVGDKYEIEGSFLSRSLDTISNSYLEVGKTNGDLEFKAYTNVRVANATIVVTKGKFSNNANSDISVLPNAAGNYGFDLMKIDKDLENEGTWNARIDGYCLGGTVKGSNLSAIDFTGNAECGNANVIMETGELPEVSFVNPVLKSGTANRPGAIYRFANVTTGIDAELTIKSFSRNDIVMQSVDLSGLGWEKALQPQFGLPGLVLPYQNWYVDFELNFFKAGTTTRQRLSKVIFTALDVDGDGWSIGEYATFANPSYAEYSPITSLTGGVVDILDPIADAGDLNTIFGTVQNYLNIDTAATQVMATFTYLNKDKVTFRYGATSSAYSSNGSGMRLNSLWAKPFKLDPWFALPVNFSNFTVMNEKGDAVINWKSEKGENLSHFVVQRSIDGKAFSDIATVFAAKTSSYSYRDKSVSSSTGAAYYRVVGVDYTKETSQTAIKMIRLSKEELQSIAIATYPNPVVNDVRITLPNTWQGKPVMLQLYSANGTIAKSLQLGSASQTETMSVNGLAKGLYIVKAVCGEEAAQQRVVKQ